MKRTLLFLASLLTSALLLSQTPKDWTIVATYDIAGKASGLAWDGGNYIYYGIYGSAGDHVYRFNMNNGTSTLQFVNPAIDDSYGMTWDGQYIWIIDQPSSSANPALATQLDLSGNVISTITLPDHYMSGIAYDNGDFWVCTYYPDPGTIYKINSSGAILAQFQSPGEQPWDICLENGDLWVADYYDHMLYKIDQSGSLLESHPSENIKPSGIDFDGSYLWYCDGEISTNPSTLYQVNLGGAGTPAISVPVTAHNYGNVTIGNNPMWNMTVSNTGTAPLIINDIDIPAGEPVSTPFNTPATVQPGNSVSVALFYIPTAPVPLDVTIEVLSNDPVNPSVPVELTGHGMVDGPSAVTGPTSHDYGLVREDAHTRWFFTVGNLGDEMLEISGITSTIPEFYIFQDVSFPIQVATLDSVLVGMWFNPVIPVFYEGTVELTTNDPAHPTLTVTLEGTGLKQDWPMGEVLWDYLIAGAFDNSPKAIGYINDITYDGVPDVIVCSEDNYVRCFNGNAHGNGDIMWEYFIYSGSVQGQNGLDIADINGDGLDEVVIGTTGGDRSIVALDGNTGALLWKHQTDEYGDGGWVYQVDCSYDYNDDGITDVLASTSDDSGDTGPRRVYCLNGLDGESIWECFTGGPNFSCLGVKDFTGDGQADAIGGGSDNGETEGRVYGIDGADGSIEWTFVTPGTSVWALEQLDDVNGKGAQEIIAGDFGGYIYTLDPETGGQLYSTSAGGNLLIRFVKLDDVNGDGFTDILLAYSGSNGVVLSGYDLSTLWFQPLADKAWVADRINDVSGDMINDAIIGTLFSNNYCYFLDGTTGEELSPIPYGSPLDAIRAIPDIVGDHSMEMVAGGRNGMLTCYSGGINTATALPETPGSANGIMAHIFPNPFIAGSGNGTTISYAIDEAAYVGIHIYDMQGRLIACPESGYRQQGIYTASWDGAGLRLAPGLYFCRISAGSQSVTLKMTLM
jgi:hypothetical protein